MSKRQRPSSLAEDTIDAVKRVPLLRSLLRVSGNELLELPDDVIINHIIGANVFVFFGLLGTNKLVREALESIRGLYFYLFKYVFRNEACLLYDMGDSSQMSDCIGGYLPDDDTLFQLFALKEGIVAQNCGKNSGDEWCIFPGAMIDMNYANSLQAWDDETYENRVLHPKYTMPEEQLMLEQSVRDHSVYSECLRDKEFAARTCRLFTILYPFGYPHASFYTVSHYHTRRLALRIKGFFFRAYETRVRFYYDDPDADPDDDETEVIGRNDERLEDINDKFHVKILQDTMHNFDLLCERKEWNYREGNVNKIKHLAALDSDALIRIDVNYLMTYWNETILPALRNLVPLVKDPATKYSTPFHENNVFFEELEAFNNLLVNERHVAKEEDTTTRYFDTITDIAFNARVSMILETKFQPIWYDPPPPSIAQYEPIVEHARQNIDAIYRVLFYRAIDRQREKEHIKSDYYFYMKGTMSPQTTCCSHCGQNGVSYEDDLFSLPFCGESCKNAAFSTYAELLYL